MTQGLDDANPEKLAGTLHAAKVYKWTDRNGVTHYGDRAPDAAGYVSLLGACADAIRAADPAAILISAGLAPTGTHDATATPDDVYLQAMYDAGFQRYVDVVGVHAPGYSAPDSSVCEARRANRVGPGVVLVARPHVQHDEADDGDHGPRANRCDRDPRGRRVRGGGRALERGRRAHMAMLGTPSDVPARLNQAIPARRLQGDPGRSRAAGSRSCLRRSR